MKRLSFLIAVVLFAEQLPADTIRDFDIPTIESLGRQMYQQDMIAAEATDVFLAQEIDRSAYPVRGWVVEEVGDEFVVTFVADYDGDLMSVFEVRKKGEEEGRFSMLKDRNLTESQSAQFRARSLARENIDQPCSDRYNFVVLPDIDEEGFIVYALAATVDPDAVLVGGHYRMMISADGRTLRQKDKLFKSCLALRKRDPDTPEGAQAVALIMSHIVSDTPVETHVFLTLLHQMTFYVVTAEDAHWQVDENGIERIER